MQNFSLQQYVTMYWKQISQHEYLRFKKIDNDVCAPENCQTKYFPAFFPFIFLYLYIFYIYPYIYMYSIIARILALIFFICCWICGPLHTKMLNIGEKKSISKTPSRILTISTDFFIHLFSCALIFISDPEIEWNEKGNKKKIPCIEMLVQMQSAKCGFLHKDDSMYK